MNVLHLLVKGEAGGIESLCRDYANYSNNKNVFAFLKGVDSVNAVKMKKSGHTVIELNYSSQKAIGVWKNLNKQIKLYSIDEIVVHHASPILYLFAWGLKLKNAYLKIVAYAHCEAEDMLSGSGKLSIKDKIIVHSFANSDKVIAISSAVRSSLIECFGLQENKICVVYNGVDLSRFKPNYNCEMHNPIRLLYVGRLVKEKGVQNILFALSKLSEKSDNSVSICDYNNVYDDMGMEREESICNIFSNKECIEKIYHPICHGMEFVAWGKLYKTSLFKNNEILYPVGKIHEDTFTTYKLLYYAERIVYVNYVGYFYRQRENSIMSSTFNMKNLSIVEATREACDFFSNNGEKYLFDCAVNSHFKTYISTFSEVLKNKNRIDEYKQVKNDLLFQYHEDIKHYLDSSDIGAGHKLFYRLFEKAPVLVVEINRIFLNR